MTTSVDRGRTSEVNAPLNYPFSLRLAMWISFLRSALRSLWKYRTYTVVNVAALALCLAVALLLILFVRSQWQTDRFHPNADRLIRVTTDDARRGTQYATTPAPLAEALRSEASIEAAATVARFARTVETDAGAFEVRGFYASESWFALFGFTLHRGDEETALSEPNRVVLSEDTAQRLFGMQSPVGETVDFGNGQVATVTGVLAPPGGPTHFPLEMIVSLDTYARRAAGGLTSWGNRYQTYTYARLATDGASPGVQQALTTIRQRVYPKAQAQNLSFAVQPVAGIGLSNHLWNEIAQTVLPPGMSITFVILALLIIAAAVFNYVNLSLARADQRSKEIGIRKSIGAQRKQLIAQFLSEAFCVTAGAMAVAILVMGAMLPWFNSSYIVQFAGTPLTLSALHDPGLVVFLLGLTMIIALLAGVYPAIRLSAPLPAATLRASGTGTGGRSNRLRNVLVGMQLAFTFLFAVTAIFAYQQSSFLLNSDHGFRTDRLLTVQLSDVDTQTFRKEIASRADVEHVSFSSLIPLSTNYGLGVLTRFDDHEHDPVDVDHYAVGEQFVENMGLRIGPALPNAHELFQTKQGIWINRTVAWSLGVRDPSNAVGKQVSFRSDAFNLQRNYTIVGVLDRVHFAPKSEDIRPMIVRPAERSPRYALVRASTDDLGGVLAGLQRTWTEFSTDEPFRGQAFTDAISPVHTIMAEASRIVLGVTALAVLVACVGLLGLAALTVNRRTSEIGIRKALGASLTNIVVLVSREYALLAGIALALSGPIAWLITQQWLRLFAYRVEVGVLPFVLCGVGLATVALGTVGTQALRAAKLDPARTLRDE